jgi:hypothetical protein
MRFDPDIQKLIEEQNISSMEELQALLNREAEAYNNRPVKEFLGLSPMQMMFLNQDPFAPGSAFQFRDCSDSDLDLVPFFRVCEEILKLTVLSKNPFKLTASTSSLPVKVVKEVYACGHITERLFENGLYKVNKEVDAINIHTAKLVLEMAKVVRKAKGNWHLTKKGEQLVKPDQRQQLFRAIFEAFTTQFNWAYHDGYFHLPNYFARYSFAFSLSVLSNFGDQDRKSSFYARKYAEALPMLLENPQTQEPVTPGNSFSCYYLRFFERFAFWFGFAEAVVKLGRWSQEEAPLRKTAVLDRLFSFPEMVEA